MKRIAALCMAAGAGFAAFAQGAGAPGGGREAFLKQQAWEEMLRVSEQIDVIETNQSELSRRIGALERGGGEIAALKAEIEALKSEIARMKGEMANQRREIVSDIVKRIPQQPARPTPPAAPAVPAGPRDEYVVQPGDTLSLVAQAFGTTVPRLKEMNGLKSDVLRIGQRLYVPALGAKRK